MNRLCVVLAGMFPLLTSVCLLAATGVALAETGRSVPLFEIQGAFEDAVVDDNKLYYLAAREAEYPEPDVRIFKIGKKGRALQVGSYVSHDHAHGIALKGQYLYLADGEYGLEIIKVSNPKKPLLIAFQNLDGYSHKVDIWRNLALVASGYSGMHILDISKPEHPALISTYQAYPPPGQEEAARYEPSDDDNGLFFGDGQSASDTVSFGGEEFYYDDIKGDYTGVEDIQVSAQDFYREEGVLDLVTDGRLVYLAYGSAGIVIVDISDPKKPRKVSELRLDSPVESIALKGPVLYVTTGIEGVQIIDVANPAAPKVLSRMRTVCYPMDVAVSAGRAYVADGYCGPDGLLVLDVDKSQKMQVAETLPGKFGSVRVWGDHLLAMGREKASGYRLVR